MRFEFSTAQQIVFGSAVAAEAGPLAASVGKRAFVVLGRTAQRAAGLFEQLTAHEIAYQSFHVTGEPTVGMAQTAVASAREAGSEVVVALGGGSVIDTGKVVAAMLRNEGELLDYLEIVGGGKPLAHPAAPHIAIPSTAGTGAEVTRNAVLSVPEHQVKVSMRGPFMLPCCALVDPLLTRSMPPELTASTGLDALTQLVEAFVSNKANPLTDGICREGLERAGRSLARAFANGSDPAAREDMALASLFSGLALANAKLGAVHGFAGPLGGLTGAPHGVICGKLLPFVMETNVRALEKRAPNSPALARFDEVARILTGNRTARASDAVAWTEQLCETFGLPGLRAHGLTEDILPAAVAKAKKASSMKGNPIALQDEELAAILERALD